MKFLIFLLLFFLPTLYSHAVLPPYVRAAVLMTPSQVSTHRHLFLGLSGFTGPQVGKLGGGAFTLGYEFQFTSFDLRISKGKTPFGSIFVKPDPAELANAPKYAGAVDVDSELNRPRTAEDSWNFLMYEPGVAISARLFRDSLPMFSQSLRVGLGLGSFVDTVNALTFTPRLVNIEARVQYQLGPNSPFVIDFSHAYYFGTLNADGANSLQTGRIPTTFMKTSLGLAYWL
ncbi:hypothetical protein WDW86_07530 [Bdellovibrionota bacterium FG-2]